MSDGTLIVIMTGQDKLLSKTKLLNQRAVTLTKVSAPNFPILSRPPLLSHPDRENEKMTRVFFSVQNKDS